MLLRTLRAFGIYKETCQCVAKSVNDDVTVVVFKWMVSMCLTGHMYVAFVMDFGCFDERYIRCRCIFFDSSLHLFVAAVH